MRAVVQQHYGGSEQLHVTDLPTPEPRAGEVLVRVHAAAVDRGTWHVMTGLPLAARLGLGLRRPRFPVPGRDLSGVVVALGPDVDGYAVGDEVIGTASGSCAELAVVPVRRMTHAPRSIGPLDAAALPISGLTALQAVETARVAQGSRVLVIGSSGGVGSYAVQVAAARGGRVTAVCGPGGATLARSLGAAEVVDRATEPLDARGAGYDAVLVLGGTAPVRELRGLLGPRGTLVIVGTETGGRWFGGVERGLRAALLSPFVRQRLVMLVAREDGADLRRLVELVDAGAVRPVIDRRFALDEVAAAVDHVAAGRARGKVVIDVEAVADSDPASE
ncbi:MAG: NAD(P)-dependent alcohol dehydrogenase, partial [Dermatophilaceae bacterium]